MGTPKWAVAVLACPRCGGALEGLGRKTSVVRCEACGPYPEIGRAHV
jgi:tRNA(Ile2) C34 agmatinyltransferase TiaS